MKMSKAFQPILLSGMHRSGTSMVTKILKDFSLEIGHKLDDNNESLFFQRINIWMMSLMGSSWDNPQSFSSINDKIKDDIVYQLQKLIDSRANSLYFGWSNVIKNKSPEFISKNLFDFHLSNESPCISFGDLSITQSENILSNDLEGNIRDNTPDLGVYKKLD